MLHIHVKSVDLGVKHSFRNFQFGILLIYGVYERIQFLCGMGHSHVLEVERYTCQQDAEYHDGAHYPEQWDTRCFHGKQFQTLAKVTERDKRCHEHGQRQSLRYKRESKLPEKTAQCNKVKSLAYKVLGVTPDHIHEQHEKTDGKRRHKQQQKAF